MHVECLLRSRQALRAFRFLQEHLDDMPGFSDPEPSFLTWYVCHLLFSFSRLILHEGWTNA